MTRRYLLPLLLLLTAPALAQTDSLRVSYSTEPPDSSELHWRQRYQYLTRANVEEKTLVKLGFWPRVGWSSFLTTQLLAEMAGEATIERKLAPAWSVLAGINFLAAFSKAEGGLQPFFGTDELSSWQIKAAAKAGFRNYYSINRRIREGKSADNFSNNYWGAEVLFPLFSYHYLSYDLPDNFSNPPSTLIRKNTWSRLPWEKYVIQPQLYGGIQRRLGRRGYFDFNLALRHEPNRRLQDAGRSAPSYSTEIVSLSEFTLNATLRFGLGW